MKIAVRGGHNFLATGSVALLNEVVEDRKIKDSTIKYLRQLGYEVLDVTPPDMDEDSDLAYGVNKANEWGADLFVSIHLNKAYVYFVGKLGSETLIYSKSDNINLDEEVAKRIQDYLDKLGLTGPKNKSRGVKERTDLYELKATRMASVIVEVCFLEATEDVALYNRLGPDRIGKAIAYAIANKPIVEVQNAPEVKEELDMDKAVLYYGDADVFSAILVGQKNKCGVFKKADFEAKGYTAKEIIQIGGKPEDTNRFVTAINASELLK